MTYLDNLGEAQTPDGRKLSLYHRHGEFYIDLDNEQLMSTRDHGSEDALARLACENLATPERPRVLIGGLGLGFTLRAALAILPPRAEVVVAELMPAVVEWNRTHLAEVSGAAMADPRVTIEVTDVQKLVGQGLPQYDAIMLDVDNGPDGWCIKSNGRLYDLGGIHDLRDTLKPGGWAEIWPKDSLGTWSNEFELDIGNNMIELRSIDLANNLSTVVSFSLQRDVNTTTIAPPTVNPVYTPTWAPQW